MSNYSILPFTFRRLSENSILLVSQGGNYHFLPRSVFDDFVLEHLDVNSCAFLDLKSKHFATDTNAEPVIDFLATQYRTKKQFLTDGPILHMMVVTVRCNHECKYCHASCEDTNVQRCDMTEDVAIKCVDTMFQCPSPLIKIEFQGGEPLLNYDVIKVVIGHAELLGKHLNKKVEFVLCSNMTLMDEAKARYLRKHNVLLSTSLDGPRQLHNACRVMRNGMSSYDTYINKLQLARSVYGAHGIDALMTTSSNNLYRLREVVDEYIKQGYRGVFIRSLNPFGFARRDQALLGYSMEQFIPAYLDALAHIIDINLQGTFFVEHNASMLLRRILTPFSDGFMDLQFPSGAGLCGVIYDYNGDVYPCDEARMLAKAGDKAFFMGNVFSDSAQAIFNGSTTHRLVNSSCSEVIPGCAECAYNLFCGSDPIRNYVLYNDLIGPTSRNDHCLKHKPIFDRLFKLIHEDNADVMNVFWSWVMQRPLSELNNPSC